MRNFGAEILDAARVASGAPSDYRVCKLTGLEQTRVSAWRTGKAIPDDSAVLELAKLAGGDPAYWLARAAEARAKDSAARAAWRRVAQRFAAAFLLGAIVYLALPLDDASARALVITSNRAPAAAALVLLLLFAAIAAIAEDRRK